MVTCCKCLQYLGPFIGFNPSLLLLVPVRFRKVLIYNAFGDARSLGNAVGGATPIAILVLDLHVLLHLALAFLGKLPEYLRIKWFRGIINVL
jgi:hypothetical protein